MKARGLTPGLLWKLLSWSAGEASGIPSVAVKCVDIRRNTGGEGGGPPVVGRTVAQSVVYRHRQSCDGRQIAGE